MARECVSNKTNYDWMPLEYRTSKSPAVRALATLIYAPSLVHDTQPVPTASIADYARFLGRDFRIPEPKGRLGKYVEELLKTLYKQSNCFIAHDLLIKGPETIGSMDFLYQGEKGVHHQEVAFKFYLCKGDASNMEDWVGPALQDNLAQKTHKLIHKQSQLGKHPLAKKKLAEMNIYSIHPEILMKGWLFYPLDKGVEIPQWAGDNLTFGFYATAKEIKQLLKDKMVTVVSKGAAIGPVACTKASKIESLKLQSNRIVVELEKKAGIYIETARFFVVEPGWPEKRVIR